VMAGKNEARIVCKKCGIEWLPHLGESVAFCIPFLW
jgi:hypothetical protein